MFTSLHSNLIAKLVELLPDHSELPYSVDIAKNKKGKKKGFAVLIGESKPTNSDVGRLTLFTRIQIQLSDVYGPEQNTDTAQLTASHTLADRALVVFTGLSASKLNSPGVRNVTLEDISEPVYVDGENTVYRTLTIEANLKV